MILNNKIAHEWMNEYVRLVFTLKTTKEITQTIDKMDAYKYRLVEEIGEQEFYNQLKLYTEKYNRLNN